jgi:hypothetical protein
MSSIIRISIAPDASVTVTVDGAVTAVDGAVTAAPGGTLTQGGLYRSTTGRTWLYDPEGDSGEPWVRVLNKNGRAAGSLIGKRYTDTQDNVSFPVRALTEGAEIQR